jgi:hypothetical protein
MKYVILVLVVIGALMAIFSGIWVAISLGSAISKDGKKKITADKKDS